ncbi:hypothetical protein BTA51_23500 [Hahella sp. CCB-MM4]|uniref:hypothetical protein n=1 Tax=Hahella sp. (strain CCB-MM4) TaxID=1926491 RepID=UPI000B9A6CE8|nr:hypothetical protein [Hahella sp. CCB-MM4]OZG70811.1 hypothetical protein BTA51_23500 [Hahella sp. CCB-MM4]
MAELTYKEISYIRSALKFRLDCLEKELEMDNSAEPEHQLDEDERHDHQEDIVFYDKLLYMFEKAEKQSEDLKVVQSIEVPERNK